MKAVILAGGMGIRLRPFTFSIPKPLLPIGEKPIIEIIITQLKKNGFREFVLAVGYKSKMLQTYCGDGSQYGVRIIYLEESKPSGTAGPLGCLKEKVKFKKDESFLLMNGDIFTNLNFLKMLDYHQRKKNEITIGVKRIKEEKPYGFIDSKNGVVKAITEKPVSVNTINAGIYIIKASVIKEVPPNTFFTMPNLINKLLLKNQPIGAYLIKEYWLGLEQLQHFEELHNNKYIRKRIIW